MSRVLLVAAAVACASLVVGAAHADAALGVCASKKTGAMYVRDKCRKTERRLVVLTRGPQGAPGASPAPARDGVDGVGLPGRDGRDGVDAVGLPGRDGVDAKGAPCLSSDPLCVGPIGANGLDAFQTWSQHELTNWQPPAPNPCVTFACYLDAIRGPRGDVGPTGSQGARGPAGADSTVPGPRGDTGSAGTDCSGQAPTTPARTCPGARGPAGLTDIVQRTDTRPIDPGGTNLKTVNCGAGETLLGGGAQILQPPTSVFDGAITGSYPTSQGWAATAAAQNGGKTLQVYAMCAVIA